MMRTSTRSAQAHLVGLTELIHRNVCTSACRASRTAFATAAESLVKFTISGSSCLSGGLLYVEMTRSCPLLRI